MMVLYALIKKLILAIQGGASTIETIVTNQETILDAMRSALSTTYTMTGSEITLYEFVPTASSEFLGGSIDMSTMQAGDTIVLKLYLKNVSGGAYTQFSENAAYTYVDAQVPAMKILSGGVFNRYGFKITATQTAGTNRALVAEWFDAAPGI